MPNKKTIIVSAINLFEGGTLSVLHDCLSYLNSQKNSNYRIIALVHKKKLFDMKFYDNLEFMEFPKSRKSYLFRLYYEYFYFRKLAKLLKSDFWLSLHDVTPNLDNIEQAVYCHNPNPFTTINFSDIFIQPKQIFFTLFYKYLYMINIKKNKYVIVQQLWIKEKFIDIFDLNKEKLIIAIPQVLKVSSECILTNRQTNCEKIFFFPTFPRPFKNIEVICEAVKILNQQKINGFKVILTINGSENKYSKVIYNKYKNIDNIKFIGLLSRTDVYKLYQEADCMIFPSKIETWGLPISEFKQFDKPILVSDLEYAKETVGDYKKVVFFDPNNSKILASHMEKFINNKDLPFQESTPIIYPLPYTNSWEELFLKLLN